MGARVKQKKKAAKARAGKSGGGKKEERRIRAELRRERKRRQYSKEEWSSETRKLTAELKSEGLVVVDVPRDGNCLFSSVSQQLEGNASNWAHYRRAACEHMEEENDFFAAFVEDDEPWDEYIERMRRPGTWGGNLELQALSIITRCNIAVYQYGQACLRIDNHPKSARVINLAYFDGEHYAGLDRVGGS